MIKYIKQKKVAGLKNTIMGKVSRLKKELYLIAAAKYFDGIGYKNFKISELAKELETSVGTIYNLFGSKEELYLEYLILKLESFLSNLEKKEGEDPLENLKLYLHQKYEIFIHINRDCTIPVMNDPYFFHKLDVSNHAVVKNIYDFLVRQLRHLIPYENVNHNHLAILFKKLSDGFIESYLYGKCDAEGIVEETIRLFLDGALIKNPKST